MTYTHKLARRLARLRYWPMLVSLALAAACASGDAPSAPDALNPGADVAAIHVTPKSAVIEPAQTLLLQAFAQTANGDSLLTSVEWTASGGAVTSAGEFRADQRGTYQVVAMKRGGRRNVTDTSVVIVTPTPSTLTKIVVSPDPASAQVGAQIAFTSSGKLSDGTTTQVPVVWSATGGTIDAGGHYTAGSTAGAFQVIARNTTMNIADTVPVTLTAAPAPTLQSVEVVPGTASVTVGGTQQFAARGHMSDGTTSPLANATFSATGGTISATGVFVAGPTPGAFTVTATSGGLSGTATVTVTTATPRVGWYVAASGSPSGDGSAAHPWDLATALAGGHGVAPGDTIWVRGGTYRGEFTNWLDGQSGRNIVVRQYPGERATIDGDVVLHGSYITLWDLEIMNSNPVATSKMGINVRSPGTKLINLVVHDAGMSGIGFWVEAPNSEVYGSIIYNNGTHNNLDHGIYFQNTSGTKRIADNVLFNNFAYGLHGYSSNGQGELLNLTLDGNASFNNGAINGVRTPDLFVGGETDVQNLTVTRNMVYKTTSDITFWMGYNYGGTNSGLTMTDNYIAGQFRMDFWRNVTVQRNTILQSAQQVVLALPSGDAAPVGYSWTGNGYQTAAGGSPFSYQGSNLSFSGWRGATGLDAGSSFAATAASGVQVFVRPNVYEPGRANVIVYNWDRTGTASADLTGVLSVGDRYEVRSVFNFYGTPVATGVYGGGTIAIPMSAVAPPAPIGRGVTPSALGPQFGAFVVRRTS
jgi:hypothetical protein